MEGLSPGEMAAEKVDRGGDAKMRRLILFWGGARVGWSWRTKPHSGRPRRECFCGRGVAHLAKLFCWLVGLVIFFYLVRRIEGIGGTVHCFSEKQTAAEGRGRCKITPEVIVILAAWLDKHN